MTVRVEIADHIAVVTLDRPPVNAVDHATLGELADAFAGLERGPRRAGRDLHRRR